MIILVSIWYHLDLKNINVSAKGENKTLASLTSVSTERPVTIALPVQNDNKAKWDSLDVKWLDPMDNDSLLAEAELPIGWSAQMKASKVLDGKGFFILDKSRSPKAEFWVSLDDRRTQVSIFSPEEVKAKEEELDIEDKFHELSTIYHMQVEFTQGAGRAWQSVVNRAHEDLKDFAESHKEFKFKIPRKKRVRDDGFGGLKTGLGIRNKYRNI